MNSVILIGRMTREADIRYSAQTNMAIARFSLAVDRQSKDKQADFPNIIAFGKTAEIIERYTHKGSQIAVQGRLQTGSYQNKDGATVYTTDVVADRIKLLDKKENREEVGDNPFSNLEEVTDLPF
jgi:single-strand binding protein